MKFCPIYVYIHQVYIKLWLQEPWPLSSSPSHPDFTPCRVLAPPLICAEPPQRTKPAEK